MRTARYADMPPPPASRTSHPPLWSNVVLVSLSAAVAWACYLLWSPVVPLLLSERGATGAAIAVAFALANVANALAQYFGGRLADRAGVRRVIGYTGIGLGVVWSAMALVSHSWQGLAVGFGVANLLFGLQSAAFITVVADSAGPERRVAAFTYFYFWSAVALVVGPLAGAFLVLPHVAPAAYLGLTGAIYLAVGLLRLFGLRDPRPTGGKASSRFSLARAVRAAAGQPRRRQLLVLTCGVTLAFALTVNGPFLALAAHSVDHLGPRFVDLLFGLGALGAVGASAWAARQRGARSPLLWALALLAASSLALTVPLGRLGVVAAYLVLFAGFQLGTVAFSGLRVELAGSEDPNEVLGATSAVAGIVAFAGLGLGGLLGSVPSLVLAAATAVATAVWAALRLGRRGAAPGPDALAAVADTAGAPSPVTTA